MIRNFLTLFLSSTLLVGLTGCASGEFFPDAKTSDNQKAKQANKPHADTLCVSKTGRLVDCQQLVAHLQNEPGLQNAQGDPYQEDTRAIHYSHPLEASNNTVLVGEYIEQMATEILRNLTIPMDDAVVGVTSFVEFSEDLSTVNHFGNMLAENFIYELQQNGIPVIDYKVTGACA
ncbi:FlgO family outer membrane protein [Psychrosphaera sp. G1-22]|uniref:FlgO family outer membrane protein n=1 Tax=Psychrosphaera algicola TaxID=3023714 RepID=A0ABT5FIW3_9GAMM|nr:FlgO family outer membrane protein [Psychrosphaera sp. G1-22]MDC2891140.1 FlgO family outer membrane protein [Psychrosphaera sp. G1-22]